MIWTTAEGVRIDVREMTDDHLRNARWAMEEGRINPYKAHKCQVPFGQVLCQTCERFRAYRVDWMTIFDREIRRREIQL